MFSALESMVRAKVKVSELETVEVQSYVIALQDQSKSFIQLFFCLLDISFGSQKAISFLQCIFTRSLVLECLIYISDIW